MTYMRFFFFLVESHLASLPLLLAVSYFIPHDALGVAADRNINKRHPSAAVTNSVDCSDHPAKFSPISEGHTLIFAVNVNGPKHNVKSRFSISNK